MKRKAYGGFFGVFWQRPGDGRAYLYEVFASQVKADRYVVGRIKEIDEEKGDAGEWRCWSVKRVFVSTRP